jgi:Zn-dependent protease with chaperone function
MRVIQTRLPILAMTVGWVVVTGRWFPRFTQPEQDAIIAHEKGHIHHQHALKRIWWLLSFQWRGLFVRCRLQEFEADAYAVTQGHIKGLTQFLVKVAMPEGPLHPSSHERLVNIGRMSDAA